MDFLLDIHCNSYKEATLPRKHIWQGWFCHGPLTYQGIHWGAKSSCRWLHEVSYEFSFVVRYGKYTRHDLINKMKTIANQLTKASNLTNTVRIQLDNIDNLCIQGMLQAQRKCCKLHTWPYRWTPPIIHLIQTIKYWQYLERRVQGKPYHARILLWLKNSLLDVLNLIHMTQEEIANQLSNNKAKLWHQLGDLNWQN